MICGIILAAGESSRMKSPKALLKIGDETFVERIISTMHRAGIAEIIVITGFHHDQIDQALKQRKDIRVVYNDRYSLGQFSSLRAGVRALPDGVSAILVWPVDLPLVQDQTAMRVKEEQGSPNAAAIPVFNGRKGHPVLYRREVLHAIQSMDDTHTGKELQNLFAGKISYVEVNDEAILLDIDTPEEYEKLINRKP
jgi:CTP:molybdopterin cytidylyltransferase MocA